MWKRIRPRDSGEHAVRAFAMQPMRLDASDANLYLDNHVVQPVSVKLGQMIRNWQMSFERIFPSFSAAIGGLP